MASVATIAVAALAAGVVTWNASYAAFSATTTSPGNTWATGTVTIGNDRSGAAVFTVPAAMPAPAANTLAPPTTGVFIAGAANAGGSTCIKVSYTGTVNANVKMYATVTNTGADGGLGQFLLMDVDTGTNTATGSDATCATYSSTGYLYGSAANTNVFANGLPSTYAAGLAGWTTATPSTSKWYRISWLLPASTAATAQAEQAQITFTWESQSI